MPSTNSQDHSIDELNNTIAKLRQEVATLRETVNLLREMVVDNDEGDYEEIATNPWDLLVDRNQGFKGMGM